jgi:hypothetical protein
VNRIVLQGSQNLAIKWQYIKVGTVQLTVWNARAPFTYLEKIRDRNLCENLLPRARTHISLLVKLVGYVCSAKLVWYFPKDLFKVCSFVARIGEF